MSVFERNLEWLSSYMQKIENNSEYADIELLPARNMQMTMRFIADKKVVYVHSAYNPEKEACSLAERVHLCYDSMIIVFGMGLLYHVKALINRAHPKCRILLIEPDHRVFERILREIDLNDIVHSGKIALSIAQNEAELRSFLKKEITSDNFIMTEVVALPAYTVRYAEEYELLKHLLRTIKEQREVENTTICNQSHIWTENIIRNMKYMAQSYRHWSFHGLFKGKPGVVVSSGPSLDKNVHLLAQLKDKVFIIAAYSSLKTLRKNGIVPDVAVAIDRLQSLSNLDDPQMLSVPLLFISTVDYRILEKSTGAKIFAPMQEDQYILDLYSHLGYEEGFIYASGSVAIAATDFAVITGCDPIIFVGQDFAFTGRKAHSEATGDNENFINKQLESAFLTDDIFGEKILTDSLMEIYRRTLESYMKHCPDPVYIDATEGGVPISGTEVYTLREVMNRFNTEKLPAVIGETLNKHFTDQSSLAFDTRYVVAFLQKLINVHGEIDRKIPVFHNEYRGAINIFTKHFGKDYKDGAGPFAVPPHEAYILKCAEIERWLLQRFSQINSELGTYIANEIASNTNQNSI